MEQVGDTRLHVRSVRFFGNLVEFLTTMRGAAWAGGP
jgi:hypothetical protein